MRKLATTLALTAAIAATTALPAFATHTHVRHVGQGDDCVIVAANGGEGTVSLPFADEVYPEGKRHPMHVLVHMGEPNRSGDWSVLAHDDHCVNAR